MRPPRDELREVDWPSVFPWLILVRALLATLHLRVLLVAAAGVLLIELGVWCVTQTLGLPPQRPALAIAQEWPWPFGVALRHVAEAWLDVVGPFWGLAAGRGTLGLCCLAFWRLAVWSLLGMAIARVALLAMTRFEAPAPLAAIGYASSRWLAGLAAPTMCLVGVGLLLCPVLLAGLASRVAWLEPLVALGWPVLLLLGGAAGLMGLGLAIAWPMMTASLAAEDADAFDAVSCAYAYSYQRPLHLLWYVLVAGVLGLSGGVLMEALSLIPGVTLRVLLAATSGEGEPLDSGVSGGLLDFWNAGLMLVLRAYYPAYLFSAAAGVYLLLRQDIDGRPMDEIALDPSDSADIVSAEPVSRAGDGTVDSSGALLREDDASGDPPAATGAG